MNTSCQTNVRKPGFTPRAFRKLNPLDDKWAALHTIPEKEYDPADETTYVYITVKNTNKDLYFTYFQDDNNRSLQIQTLLYSETENHIWGLEGHQLNWNRSTPDKPPQYSFRPSILDSDDNVNDDDAADYANSRQQ